MEGNQGKIKKIKEKVKISDLACTGAYGFASWKLLLKFCQMKMNIIDTSSEIYISHIIQEMINSGINFNYSCIEEKNYYSLGTPQQILKFQNQFTFLLDLDGTLVDTDKIYTHVWNQLLKKYYISVDESFFYYFIRGKSDSQVLKYLISDITEEEIGEISNQKDNLFVDAIQEIPYLHQAPAFFQKIKGAKTAIVTNSNRKSAMKLTSQLEYDILISATDCENLKPHPEPYLKAIEYLKADPEKTFIFEDSGTGYVAAKSSGVKNIILFKNKNTTSFPLESNHFEKIISSFDEINWNQLLLKNETYNENDKYIASLLKQLKNHPIKSIIKNKENIKTGYICNIYSYKLKYNKFEEDIILKIANYGNQLAKTAQELDLYQNECYFYQYISPIVNLAVPKFYGIIEDTGIIIQKLDNGKFNLN